MAQVKAFSLGGIGSPCCCAGGTKVCVVACDGTPQVGAVIKIYTGVTLIDSCTTDSTGCCTLPETGTYLLTVTVDGVVVYSDIRDLSGGIGTFYCVEFCFTQCNGIAIPGATFTVSSGGTDFASGTTDASGCVELMIPSSGTYKVTLAYGGNTLTVDALALASGFNIPFIYPFIQVSGCQSELPGATVVITPDTGLSLSTSTFTTDGAGIVQFPYLSLAATYGYSISYSRFTTLSGTTSACQTFTLLPASGFQCACACNIPFCETLDLTDTVTGSTTLVYNAGLGYWVGTISYGFPGFCGCPAASPDITYSWPSGGDCTQINIDFPVQSVTSPCGNVISNCPDSGATTAGLTVSLHAPPGICDFPLDCTFEAASCTCIFCLPGVPEFCSGNAGLPALWGGSSLSVTLVDAC